MIGRLRFPYRHRTTEAVLHEEGWECPEIPTLVRVLDTLYHPGRDGQGDRRHLDEAARWLKGTVEAETSTPPVTRN
ncbi:hypothetical protein P12x_002690 [Tundrisphaera lichenicola]|uniref:hypothetical protein n=1 Tax=Tundrisphaera lichenicola TaxID=2029860 RepID=UPI003EB7D56A